MSDHEEQPANRLREELPDEVPPSPSVPGQDPQGARPERNGPTGRQRLLKGLWPPRLTRAQLIVALLLFGLGFGLAVQVASNSDSDSALRGARQEDLVRILDELDDRTQRLEDEKQGLEKQRDELENSSDQAEEARKQTLEKERQLGILAGTVAAQGPGITVTIEDTKGTVEADMLLDAIQELRAAGGGGDPGERRTGRRRHLPRGRRQVRQRRREQDQRALSFPGHRQAAGPRTGSQHSWRSGADSGEGTGHRYR
ncbi:hypothetical protein RKD29_001267 [Streptomyces tendae]